MHATRFHDGPPPPPPHPYRPEPFQAPRYRVAPRPRAFRAGELVAAVALVVALDVAFWAGGPRVGGFGGAAFFIAAPVVLVVAVRAWRRSLRLAVIGALLLAVAARTFASPNVSSALLGLVLTGAFALSLRARDTFVPGLAASAAATLLKLPSRVHGVALGIERVAARTRIGNASVLPIVVPFALVGVFLGVFALANPVVATGLGSAVTLISRVIEFPSFGRVVSWGVAFVIAALLVRPALRRRAPEAVVAPADASTTSLLVARNALAGLNLLFLGYNALDARYLWAGAPPAGMRTQQYAHEGAFWLTIALVLLTGVVSVMFRGALVADVRARDARRLAFVWMAQGLVLGLASYRRIAIHIARSGLSDLRIVGILGTSLVLVGVVLVAAKLHRRESLGWLVRRQLDALAVTAVLYAVLPTHLVSARVNVERALGGELRPLLHAFRQTRETESSMAYLALLDHPDVRVRQGIASLLTDEHRRLRFLVDRDLTWRERDLATGRVFLELDAAMPRINRELATVDAGSAHNALFNLAKAANEDRPLDEIRAIPTAAAEAVMENR